MGKMKDLATGADDLCRWALEQMGGPEQAARAYLADWLTPDLVELPLSELLGKAPPLTEQTLRSCSLLELAELVDQMSGPPRGPTPATEADVPGEPGPNEGQPVVISDDAGRILEMMGELEGPWTAPEVAENCELKLSTARRRLAELVDAGLVRRSGKGRGTRYEVV